MARVLDFNTVQRPVLELVMQDENHTRIKVSTPTAYLVEELNNMAPEFNEIFDTILEEAPAIPDEEMTARFYDLAARLINCNRSYIKVTGEELRTKYHMDLEALVIFFGAYTDFINELDNAKN